MSKVIYVDNNATTRVHPEVRDAMLPYLTELYGNPSSMHSFGGAVEKDFKKARAQVASLLGCDSNEVVFTSCGTESNNTAIRGTLEQYPNKKHIITTKVEHPAVLNVFEYLESKGYQATYLDVDEKGQIDLDQLAKALRSDTALVSTMYANNETGVIFPIEEIGKLVKAAGAVFHVDAVQAVGKIPLNLKTSTIDLLSISGHKLHAPKGIGALYVKRGTKLRPYLLGGHQEKGRRAGTENIPSIIALGMACEIAQKNIENENTKVKELRDYLEAGILKAASNARVNGDRLSRLPNTTNISFEYIEGEAILLLLDQLGIAASSGSACTSGSLEPSHVLRAMKVPFTCAHGSIRFSLSVYNTKEEADYIIENIGKIIERLRTISPFGQNKKSEWLEQQQAVHG